MALKNNAVCDICGKPYHVCNTCKEVLNFKPWRSVTDTMQHYKIFLAVSDYTRKKDKVNAKAALENCDLSDLETFRDDIKDVINEIMADNKRKSASRKKSTTDTESQSEDKKEKEFDE